jgi:hypothetical protein
MNRVNYCVLYQFIAITIAFCSASCNDEKGQAKKAQPNHKTLYNPDSIKNCFIIVKGDSLRVRVDNHFITVPKKSVVYYDSVYNGIYKINNKVIKQVFSTQINNIVYFTTYCSVGMGYRGYLYAFDLKEKRLLKSDSTKANYVFSSGGIFFLTKERVFSVSKPNHEKAEQPFITVVEIHTIKGGKFHYIKYVVAKGEMTYDDASIVKLYSIVTKQK